MIIFYVVAVLVFLCDQVTKSFAEKALGFCQSLPLFPNLLHFTLVHNRGAAFGILQNYSAFLWVVPVVVMLVVLYFHWRLAGKKLFAQTGLALVFGGSLGNLVDRLRLGYVVDFIDFRFWPVFNFADVFINLGVLILVIYLLEQPQT